MQNNQLLSGPSLIVFRLIFYCCAIYFLLLGIGLVFFPYLLVKGTAGVDVSPTIIGMLRGAGGSLLPYSLLYFMIARKPFIRKWALNIIALANIVAIILDFGSVLMDEYKFSYAMIDVPIEVLSLGGILIILAKIRSMEKKESKKS
ncbi:MAG: hypothetical protein K8R41_10340 [Bacteroidales bacterium]|nr:hypothetical protein [Bacteroidales bacterium]